MNKRTDLALEAREINGTKISGVDISSELHSKIEITRMNIKTQKASKILGKPCGNYITIDIASYADINIKLKKYASIIAEEIKKLIPDKGLILVAGLGNSEITPDDLGPQTALSVIATRHIVKNNILQDNSSLLRRVSVISPGVLGQTGIETGEILLSLTKRLNPLAIIAIDAMASRNLKRLCTTFQISDTGICPGAGVGNARPKIDKQSMGVPVISVGVPTVVDAETLLFDLIGEESNIKISPIVKSMMVSHRDIDILVRHASKLLALALNCALQTQLSTDEIISLMS